MSDELRALEDAKAEALAAFSAIAAIIDCVDTPVGSGRGESVKALRDEAVRHLDAALTIMSQGQRPGPK